MQKTLYVSNSDCDLINCTSSLFILWQSDVASVVRAEKKQCAVISHTTLACSGTERERKCVQVYVHLCMRELRSSDMWSLRNSQSPQHSHRSRMFIFIISAGRRPVAVVRSEMQPLLMYRRPSSAPRRSLTDESRHQSSSANQTTPMKSRDTVTCTRDLEPLTSRQLRVLILRAAGRTLPSRLSINRQQITDSSQQPLSWYIFSGIWQPVWR